MDEDEESLPSQAMLWQMRRQHQQRRWRCRRPSSCCAFQFISFALLFSVNKFYSIGHFIHFVAAVTTCTMYSEWIETFTLSTWQVLSSYLQFGWLVKHLILFSIKLLHFCTSVLTLLTPFVKIYSQLRCYMKHMSNEYYHGKKMTLPHAHIIRNSNLCTGE